MKVRVFASLRDAAGGPWMEADGSTVGELLSDIARRYGVERTLPHCKVIVNDVEVSDQATPLRESDEVALLPPVAGG